jgi:hypothetical protein
LLLCVNSVRADAAPDGAFDFCKTQNYKYAAPTALLPLRPPKILSRKNHPGRGPSRQELAVADAGPARLRDGFDEMAGKFTRQIFWQAFVEEDAVTPPQSRLSHWAGAINKARKKPESEHRRNNVQSGLASEP